MARLYKTQNQQMFHAGKIAIVLVGLPARGKTYISLKLSHYLKWLGVKSSPFSLATYRDQLFGKQTHDFFDPENKDAIEQRKILANKALGDMETFFASGGQVAIFDGTNVTKKQRQYIKEYLSPKVQVVYIEVINNNSELLNELFVEEMKTSPNYAGSLPSQAHADLSARIDHYIKIYETITEDENLSYIKMINFAENIKVYNVKGYLQTRIVFFLMNVHIGFRNIFLCRDNFEDCSLFSDGGRKPLSPKGQLFGERLKKFILEQVRSPDGLNFGEDNQPLSVWTSTTNRSKELASYFQDVGEILELNALVDMNPGVTDGLTLEQIKEKYPVEYSEYEKDVYNYRMPRAECYRDVSVRLEHVTIEIERSKGHVLIIAQKPVLQILYSYFTEFTRDHEEVIPTIPFPEYSVIQLRPRTYTCLEKVHMINME